MINDAQNRQPNDAERAAERESVPTPLGRHPRALGWFPRELRYALRALRRRPGFSVVAILTLGIGIGGLTAIASIIRGVLLTPLPLPESDRLVTYWLTAPDKGLGEVDLTDALFAYQRERTRVLAGLAAYTTDGFNLSGVGEPERLVGAEVTDNFFRVLGVRPLSGREFLARETTPGNDHVAILSQGFWTRHFGADPSIVGRVIDLNGSPVTVVGVMPRAADFPRQTDVWVPAVIDPHRYSYWYLRTLGRLRPGHTVEDMRREIGALTDAFAVEHPESQLDASGGQTRVVALKLTQSIVGDLRTPLLVLLASVVGVLLIACANIGTLSLARAIAREREMAVRRCLGATRRRLAAQLLTESALVAVAGSVIGVASAIWSIAGLRHWSQGQIPRLDQVRVDPLTLVLVAAVTIACGLLFGLAPAWVGSRVETRDAISAGSRGSARTAVGRWNDALVIAQFALSLALLIPAGLLVESFTRLTAVDPGFRADNVLLARLETTSQSYGAPRAVLSFYDAVLERIAALPGVRAAGVTSHVPFSHGDPQDEFVVEGREPEPGQPIPVTSERAVSPTYFAAIGTRIVAGRDFRPSDDSGAPPVAVVNETFARRYWPTTDPIGKRLHFGTTRGNPWMTVIGLVGDTKESSLANAPKFQVYQPIAQSVAHEVVLVVRTQTAAADIGPAVRAAVRALDLSIPVYNVHTMDVAVAQSLSSQWLTNVTLAGFAAVALLLAAIGVYGVLSLAVAGRIREFGIRLAIGARPTEVVHLVLRDGVRLAALGMAIGLVASAWLTRFLSSLLFATPALDPITFGGVAALLGLVAIAACCGPAYRAARADPVSALKATD